MKPHKSFTKRMEFVERSLDYDTHLGKWVLFFQGNDHPLDASTKTEAVVKALEVLRLYGAEFYVYPTTKENPNE